MVSSNISPLSFFEDFFPKGFNEKYDEFFHASAEYYSKKGYTETEISYILHFESIKESNKEEDFIISEIRDEIVSEPITCKLFFSDAIQEFLDKEIDNILKLINDLILQKNTFESLQVFVHNLLLSVVHIIDDKISVICNSRYVPQCQSILISFIKEIGKRYPDYVSKEEFSYKQYLLPKEERAVCALKMIPNKFHQLHSLLGKLKQKGFLEQSLPLSHFEKVFDGDILDEPLNIKWMKMEKGQYYIGAALKMIMLLDEKKYITGYKDKQLSYLFVKGDGSWIDEKNAWKNARKNIKANPYNPSLLLIEEIINNFH